MFQGPEYWGQFFTLLLLAVALGMDAFSLGLSIGIRGVTMRKVYVISVLIGFFHFFMPLLGMLIGHVLSVVTRTVATNIGGALLCILGINMIWSGLKNDREQASLNVSSVGATIVLALSVSVDTLSAGLSFGLFSANVLLAVILLGSGGAVMAGLGLLLGRYANKWLGDYGELIGGAILCGFGVKFLL